MLVMMILRDLAGVIEPEWEVPILVIPDGVDLIARVECLKGGLEVLRATLLELELVLGLVFVLFGLGPRERERQLMMLNLLVSQILEETLICPLLQVLHIALQQHFHLRQRRHLTRTKLILVR